MGWPFAFVVAVAIVCATGFTAWMLYLIVDGPGKARKRNDAAVDGFYGALPVSPERDGDKTIIFPKVTDGHDPRLP